MQTNEIAAVKTILYDFTIRGLVKTRYRNEGWDSEESWCSWENIGELVNLAVDLQVNYVRDTSYIVFSTLKFHVSHAIIYTIDKLPFGNRDNESIASIVIGSIIQFNPSIKIIYTFVLT